MITLVKVGDPAFEPVTFTDARRNARLRHAAHDPTFKDLITAATLQFERDTNLQLGLQEFDQSTDAVLKRVTELRAQPAVSITSLKYTDEDDATQTVDSGNYSLKAYRDPPELELDDDYTIPSDAFDAVIRFKAGFADAASVPKIYKRAILMLVEHWFRSPNPVSNPSTLGKPLPLAYERIVTTARVKRFR